MYILYKILLGSLARAGIIGKVLGSLATAGIIGKGWDHWQELGSLARAGIIGKIL